MIPGYSYFPSNATQNLGKLTVFIVGHLIAISLLIASRSMRIWWIAIKQRFLAIITPDDINGGSMFYLNA